MWFASMSRPSAEPWLLHFTWKLLENDPNALKLVGENPFPDEPPENIRILAYRYEYAEPSSNKTWRREKLGVWLQPVSKESQRLERFIERRWS